MSTIAATATAPTDVATRTHSLRRAALTSGAIAAVGTTAVAAAADAAGVPLAIDGETIPLLGFAQMTLLGAVLGGLIAAALRRYSSEPRKTFVVVAAVLTALSCVPSVAMPPDVATRVVLVATHLLASVIIVPTISRHTHR